MSPDWHMDKPQEVSIWAGQIEEEVTRILNQSYLVGVVAGCVIVACADYIVRNIGNDLGLRRYKFELV